MSVADPPGYATATLSGGVIKVRDAKLAPGKSLSIAISATAPCSAGALAWSATGYPLTLDVGASQLTTTVTGACALRFVAGHTPADARIGQTITASPYDPGGSVLQVEVIDGGGSRVTSSTATIDRHVLSAQHRSWSSVQMCFGAPYPFTPRPGASLHSLDTNGDGAADFYYALLPDCGTAPCVAKRKQNGDCDAVIVTKAPGGSQDPAYRP